MSFFLVRHGIKEHNNTYDRPYGLDPSLNYSKLNITPDLQSQITTISFSKIVCSPFRRCRQTATLIRRIKDFSIPIVVDNRLTEFLGHHPPKAVDNLHWSTWHYHPAIITRYSDYESAILDFPFEPDTLYVLHGLGIKIKAKESYQLTIREVPELTGIQVDTTTNQARLFLV